MRRKIVVIFIAVSLIFVVSSIAKSKREKIETEKKKEENFKLKMESADSNKAMGIYSVAINEYLEAKKIKNDPEIDKKILEIQVIEVMSKIQSAKTRAWNNEYKEAIVFLEEAKVIATREEDKKEIEKLIKEYEEAEKYKSTEEYKIAMEKSKKEQIAFEKKLEKNRIEREKEKLKKKKSEGVSIGMTQEEVLQSSWGKPKDINKTITKYGVNEQWVYANYNYLYFEDGILVTIQN